LGTRDVSDIRFMDLFTPVCMPLERDPHDK
jgi:hypothetical protein